MAGGRLCGLTPIRVPLDKSIFWVEAPVGATLAVTLVRKSQGPAPRWILRLRAE